MKSEGETRAGQGAAEEFGASTRHTRCPGDSNVRLCWKQKTSEKCAQSQEDLTITFSDSFKKLCKTNALLSVISCVFMCTPPIESIDA